MIPKGLLPKRNLVFFASLYAPEAPARAGHDHRTALGIVGVLAVGLPAFIPPLSREPRTTHDEP